MFRFKTLLVFALRRAIWEYGSTMKTTIELPDPLFRRAKTAAIGLVESGLPDVVYTEATTIPEGTVLVQVGSKGNP